LHTRRGFDVHDVNASPPAGDEAALQCPRPPVYDKKAQRIERLVQRLGWQ
jgi:hypothetical protein